MLDFEFMSPTQFVFGRGVEEKVGDKLAERGAKKVLLHFGGQSAVRSGLIDRVCASLDAAGVEDIRLCVNLLTRDFVKLRPIPDLDWLIDQVCAQLIAVLPFDEGLVTPVAIGQNINLSNVSKIIFDNFAQRILGNYIDLLVQ